MRDINPVIRQKRCLINGQYTEDRGGITPLAFDVIKLTWGDIEARDDVALRRRYRRGDACAFFKKFNWICLWSMKCRPAQLAADLNFPFKISAFIFATE